MGNIPVEELRVAASRPEVIAAMEAFYADADRLVAEKNPTCWNRGLCCRFGEYGHRLYVTALEAAWYLGQARCSDFEGRQDLKLLDHDVCPHAFGGICHVRTHRPLGCRIFFCDPAAQHWQGPLTEDLLARLRTMHDELRVPYFYADWIRVLRALNAGAR